MKNMKMKSILLLALVVAVLMGTVGGTVAYLVTSTDPVENTFTPAEVTTEIDEGFDGKVKSYVKITNAGDIPVYVRAKVVGNWCDAQGNIVAPWTDNITYNTDAWTQVGDYWYHKGAVAAGSSTASLFASYSYESSEIPEGADHLVLDVLHQSIQAEPDEAVKSMWGDAALAAVKAQ